MPNIFRLSNRYVAPNNAIAVSGDTYAGDGWEYFDVPTIRYSSSGQLLWTDVFGSALYAPNNTEEWSLNMFALPGDQILTISTDWARPGYDYALHRYASDGQLLERAVRELSVGDIKDMPVGCAQFDSQRNAVFMLGWGSGFPANPIADHYALIRVDLGAIDTPGDVDGDGDVDISDLATLLAAFGACTGEPGFNAGADFDASGCVELSDLATLLANFGS